MLRKTDTKVVQCDVNDPPPINVRMTAKFGIVLALFCVGFCGVINAQSCFVDGECDVASFHVGGNVVKNKEECLQLCKGKLCPYLK